MAVARSSKILVATALALAAVAALAAGACGGEEEAPRDAGLDGILGGDTSPAIPNDAEPPPGDVCGDRTGLQPGSPWPLRGGCPTRAGFSSTPGPQTAGTFWRLTTAATETSPAIVAPLGFLWIGTDAGEMLAIQNGAIHSIHTATGPVRSSAAIDANGNAIMAGGDGVLYGLKPGDAPVIVDAGADAGDAGVPVVPAKVIFALPIGPSSSSPVIGADGTIYIGTNDGRLLAVTRNGSSVAWSFTTNDVSGSPPALGQDGTIYVGSSDKKLYAVRPDGSQRWATDLGDVVTASAAVGGDGSVYVGTRDGALHKVDPDGKRLWSYRAAGPITGTPAVYAGAVYAASEDKSLHAVNTRDGTKRWTYATLGIVASPVIGPTGTVYVGSADGNVYAITPKGTLYFAVNVRGKVRSGPAIGPGPALYVATDRGVVSVGP